MRLLLLMLFLSLSLFGKSIVTKNSEIFIDTIKVGTVYKGAFLTKKSDMYVASGWVMDGNEYILFYNNEERIKLLKIEETSINRYEVIETKKDAYDVTWKHVRLNFHIKTAENILENTTENIWAHEEELYLRCGSCHKAHTPEEYTINQWPNVLKTMSDRAGFSPEEVTEVGNYLQYKALNYSIGGTK